MVNRTEGPHFQPMFQIRRICKMAELWPKCDFQYGGRGHLGFCRIRVLRVKIVHGPYSRCLYQIWCKSVQKWRSYGRLTDFKMAAAAILNLLPVSVFIIWSSLDSGWGCSCKIEELNSKTRSCHFSLYGKKLIFCVSRNAAKIKYQPCTYQFLSLYCGPG